MTQPARRFPDILAQAAAPELIHMGGEVSILAAAAGDKPGPRQFAIQAYSGGMLALDRYSLPVVIDLNGMTAAKSIVANMHHDRTSIVGHVTDKTNDGRQLSLKGVVSGTGPAAQEVLANHDNGFPWQASVEAKPLKMVEVAAGKTVSVNGQDFVGPLLIARKSKLFGIAFVPRGADENTSVSIAASAAVTKEGQMTFQQWIEAMGLDHDELNDRQKSLLQKKFDAEIEAAAKAEPASGHTENQQEQTPAAFDLDDLKAACAEHLTDIEAKLAEHGEEISDAKKRSDIVAAARKNAKELKARAIKERWATPRYEVEAIKASAAFELDLVKAKSPLGPSIQSSRKDASPDIIEAALCLTVGLPNIEKSFDEKTLDAADRQFRGLGLQQLILMAAAENGYACRPGERMHAGNYRQVLRHALPMVEAASSTLSLPGILGNIANKEILAGYQEEDQTWRQIAAIKTVNNFHAVTSYRLLDDMEYEQVGPTGEIRHGSVGQESYTRKADTYAKMFGLTREDIINDDAGAFDDLRTRLGMGAAKKFNKLFWSKFLNNSAFFTAGRGNYLTGTDTVLDIAGSGLEKAVTAFRKLRSPAADGSKRLGNTIGGRAEILLVPPELEFIAARLYQSTLVNTGGSSTASAVPNENIHAGKYRPVVSDFLSDAEFTGYSSTAWYLFRAANQYPVAVVSFLNGQQAPTVESAEASFNYLGIEFRGYHDFGVDLAEYLAGVKCKGAA